MDLLKSLKGWSRKSGYTQSGEGVTVLKVYMRRTHTTSFRILATCNPRHPSVPMSTPFLSTEFWFQRINPSPLAPVPVATPRTWANWRPSAVSCKLYLGHNSLFSAEKIKWFKQFLHEFGFTHFLRISCWGKSRRKRMAPVLGGIGRCRLSTQWWNSRIAPFEFSFVLLSLIVFRGLMDATDSIYSTKIPKGIFS